MKISSQALDILSHGVLKGTAWWSGCIAALQGTGAVLEFWRNEPLLLGLDIASASMSACAAIVCMSALPVKARKNLAVFFVTVTLFFEVETAFHDPDYAFHDSHQYLIVIVAMLFLAIVFPSTPAAFIVSCLAYIGYYLFRPMLTGAEFPESRTMIVFVLQLLFSVVVCAGIQFWIFRMRYSNIIQAEELSAAQTKLGRQMMLRDIHDHLGAKLADFSNLVAKVRTDRSEKMFSALETAAAEAAHLLRRGLLAEKDREMLSEDFGSAIRVILFGRYEAAGRQILIRFNDMRTEDRLRALDPQIRNDLLAAILEITTNDLKYGCSTSVLDFRLIGGTLLMRFLAATTRPKSRGLGTASVHERVQSHGGSVSILTDKKRILIRMTLPGEVA